MKDKKSIYKLYRQASSDFAYKRLKEVSLSLAPFFSITAVFSLCVKSKFLDGMCIAAFLYLIKEYIFYSLKSDKATKKLLAISELIREKTGIEVDFHEAKINITENQKGSKEIIVTFEFDNLSISERMTDDTYKCNLIFGDSIDLTDEINNIFNSIETFEASDPSKVKSRKKNKQNK